MADFSQNQSQYGNIDPRFLEVHKNTLTTQLNRIKEEIREYELETQKQRGYNYDTSL